MLTVEKIEAYLTYFKRAKRYGEQLEIVNVDEQIELLEEVLRNRKKECLV